MHARRNLVATIGALGLGLGLLASAAGAADEGGGKARPGEAARIGVLERHGKDLGREIKRDRLEDRYLALHGRAGELGIRPERDPSAAEAASAQRLGSWVDELGERIEESASPVAAGGPGATSGVSQATLESIASCESGGDPSAVNGAGYYGKYQFDISTWQSVGGSGNPAEASEAEQDRRAALLYSRVGSSAWPVCGA